MKIALIQMQMSSSPQENLQKSLAMMKQAAEQGENLDCFPDLQFSPFFPQYSKKDVSEFVVENEHPIFKAIA